ncbi:putative peptidoglycan binding protein [Rhodobacter aestuarii]|uniref:Putative peptidoglycan binding domain-containing protein n=2 Tax=Rhodobacter group TaxID=3374108 RepID=A0A1N7LZB1_9RHOB|nr:putative peptidoglycan binding protein [Rhodobacter aestuarii]SIS79153.1 Putative peptidoglycan binding domain-containing protein [Rhodobacter aestuarii]SOC14678.1 putative peptidoglycan binding protein [Rhodobacter sp. JA431]
MPEPQSTPVPPPGEEPEIITAAPRDSLAGEWRAEAPDADEPGCFMEQFRPAVVETVTEHELVSAEVRDKTTGTVTRPASYRSTTQARIVEGGEVMWFQRVCEQDMTPALIATLQRALLARGYYTGDVTGQLSAQTQEAVKAYQAQRGLISPVLSRRAAQEMGLIIWDGSPAAAPEAQAPG